MVQGISNDLGRFSGAARALMEGNLADPAAGHFSTIMFMASDGRQPLVVEAALAAARSSGLGAVVLDFGPGSRARGPRDYTAAVIVDGRQVIVRDCLLWLGVDGRALLVPRDRQADHHVCVSGHGLELRQGRPAASLAAGAIRATNRMIQLSKKRGMDDMTVGIKVVDLPIAA